jgi:hypothetical protein
MVQWTQSQIDSGLAQYVAPTPPAATGTLVNVTGPPVRVQDQGVTYAGCPTFGDANVEDAVTMKNYNGSDNYYVAWTSVSAGLTYYPIDANTGRYYVQEVCAEVEVTP